MITRAILLAILLLTPTALARQEIVRLATPSQPSAPVQIAGAMFGGTTLTVLLVNVSGRTIEQSTMGLVLQDAASTAQTVTRTGNACIATVPPEGFLVVTAAHNGLEKALAYLREKAIAHVIVTAGVVNVRFADGSEWTFPLETRGRFDEDRDPTTSGRAYALKLKEKQFPGKDMSWAYPDKAAAGKVSTCSK